MLALGPIGFIQPLVLSLLVALPVIWWLLRFTPPRPVRVAFPPFRLLLGLEPTEETPDRSPWWLTALRILAALLVILAFARPVLNPEPEAGSGEGPLVIIVDNGWAAAPHWPDRARLLAGLLDEAEQEGRRVAVVPTARGAAGDIRFSSAADLRPEIQALQPRPHAPRRAISLETLPAALDGEPAPDIVWLADGLDYGDDADVADDLAARGTLTMFAGAETLWLYPPRLDGGDLAVDVARTGTGPLTGEVVAYALNGRTIGREAFALAGDETAAEVRFTVPTDLRNQIARVEIAGARNAGGVSLLDDRWRRRVVGLVSGASVEIAQPLLSPLFYVERALAPYTELRKSPAGTDAGIADLVQSGLSMLILADVGNLLDEDSEALRDWVDKGGTLVRFAGPRLAASADTLLPVALRRGGRSLGGALSWEQPQPLTPFDEDSPFFGLALPEEVAVERQVLAEPGLELAQRTWARLADGTPLVTASRVGRGRIVLFHITANASWSNLPLSGLFVEMLRRLVDLSEGVGAAATETAGPNALLRPRLALDGFGRLLPPPSSAEAVPASEIAAAVPGPARPPGYYGPEDAPRALNTTSADHAPAPLAAPSAATVRTYEAESEIPLARWLILAAFALLLADIAATLFLSGRLRIGRTGPAAAASLALAILLAAPPAPAYAQESGSAVNDLRAMQAALQTRFAYVITGDSEVDRISDAGLQGLSLEIANRTALEPAMPVGVNIEADDLVFFPLIYWPVLEGAGAPSEAALAKLDTYLKTGGTILFDTRDQLSALPTADTRISPAVAALRRVLGGLDIPPLEPVPPNHVLTKAFYLLQTFPGRFDGGELWVEALGAEDRSQDIVATTRTNTDGVSSVIIGANDYAGAWARTPSGEPALPVVPGGPGQREMAYRVGVNVVMYTLTGNYKADQVHVPSLLERLGQ